MGLQHDPTNTIVAGVGGQGNILASALLSQVLCRAGFSVSVGETYGATQRGGAVFSHVRCSQRHPFGPLIPQGEAHVIVGFEPLEVYRTLRSHGHPQVRVVTNRRPFYPVETLQKTDLYPDVSDLLDWITKISRQTVVVDATALAQQAGHAQCLNVVMVGALCGLGWLPLEKTDLLAAVDGLFSGEKRKINHSALELGFQATCDQKADDIRAD